MIEAILLRGILVKNQIIIAMSAIGVSAAFTLLSDSSPVIKEHYGIFFITKIMVLVACIFCITMSPREKYLSCCKELVPITAIFYMCTGEYFAPGYNLIYTQLMIFIPLVLRMPLKRIMIYIAASLFLFLVSAYFGRTLFTTVTNYPNYSTDVLISIFTSTFLGALLTFFVKGNEEQTEKLKNRYINFGLNTSAVIHDLKNKLMVPYRQLSSIKNSPESEKAVVSIEESISKLQDILSFHEIDHSCDPKEVVMDVVRLMELESRGISVIETGDCDWVPCAERDVRSVVTNIFSNSIYMSELQNIDLTITVKFSPGKFIIEDNGVGYPPKAIKNFQNYIPSSERRFGNGVGLINSRLLIETCGGKMTIYNHLNGGAATEIKFHG